MGGFNVGMLILTAMVTSPAPDRQDKGPETNRCRGKAEQACSNGTGDSNNRARGKKYNKRQ
jgi:hypothetical protein